MQNKYYPNLAQPITINGLTFKNRIFASPMSNPEMDINAQMRREDVAFHEYRVSGGIASVCIGLGVVEAIGRTHTKEVKLYDPMSLPSMTEYAKAIHRQNANAVMELQHGGKYANARGHGDAEAELAYSPNDEYKVIDGVKTQTARAMTEAEILETAECFGRAAALCQKAGIDMVLIHAGHGWLLHQFISPAMNKRTDKWGGSLENRMRFLMLAIEKIREYTGPNYPIEVRYSGAELDEGGYTIEEGIEIAKMLDGKIDLIHVSVGVHENPEVFAITHPSMFVPEGCNVKFAAEVKKHVKTPVATVGGLNDIDQMEEIIASGKADIVELARQSICDPQTANKAFSGRKDDIVRCCRCFTCFYNYLTNRTFSCAFNPVVGNELAHTNAFPPTTPKKVLVVGGGPAGMMAAVTAADRGHTVSLYEKDSRLGGKLLAEEHMPHKANMFNFVKVMERRIKNNSNIELKLGTAITGEEAAKMNFDAIIVTVGATPIVPPIPGIDKSIVAPLEALHCPNPELGQKVVIIGGGLVACDSAVFLDSLGKDVTIVEMMPEYAADSYFMHYEAMNIYFRGTNIKINVNTRATEVKDNGLLCAGPEGEVFYEADSILLAAGMRENKDLTASFYNAAPLVLSAGDNVKVARVGDATSGGYYAALKI